MSDAVNRSNCINEINKQIIATDERELIDIFRTNCAESRSSFKCDKNCGSSVANGNFPEAVQVVSNLRK